MAQEALPLLSVVLPRLMVVVAAVAPVKSVSAHELEAVAAEIWPTVEVVSIPLSLASYFVQPVWSVLWLA